MNCVIFHIQNARIVFFESLAPNYGTVVLLEMHILLKIKLE